MHSVATALFYLRATGIRNAFAARIKRLKQPKYLFGAIAGAAYLYLTFFRQFRMHRQLLAVAPADVSANLLDLYHSPSATVDAVLLGIFVLLYWLWPRARAALTFTEAEIAFLFPAPISRRALIHYRIINLMLGLLMTSLIFSVLSSNTGFLPGNIVMRFVGWWMMLFTLGLHSIASSFMITRLFDRGITSLRRQVFVLLGAIAIISVLGWWTWRALPFPVGNIMDAGTLKEYVTSLFNTALLSWLLLPAKLVIGPLLASNWITFVIALLPAALVAVIHYYWVIHAEVSFEEASIIKAEKRATKLAAIRAGRTRPGSGSPKVKKPPFDINFIRGPEIAFLWKNLLATATYLRLKTMWMVLLAVIIGCQWMTNGQHEALRNTVSIMAAVFSAYALFFGPVIVRQDLRSDLLNADILKTYPLRGWQIVLGEVLTPVIVITVIFWLLLLIAALGVQTEHIKWATPLIHWSGALAIAVIGLLLCTLQMLVLNAAAILFPAWVQINRNTPGGIEGVGQRLLFMAGLILIALFLLLPAALFSVLIFFLTKWLVGAVIAVTLASLTTIVILVVEIVFGLEWLGEKFEQFDLSAELRA